MSRHFVIGPFPDDKFDQAIIDSTIGWMYCNITFDPNQVWALARDTKEIKERNKKLYYYPVHKKISISLNVPKRLAFFHSQTYRRYGMWMFDYIFDTGEYIPEAIHLYYCKEAQIEGRMFSFIRGPICSTLMEKYYGLKK